MLVQRIELIGIDSPIDRFQSHIFKHVSDAFRGVDKLKYYSYPRIYRNLSSVGKVIPEAYIGNNQYSDKFIDDKLDILSFFDTSEVVKYDGRFVAEVSQIYTVNLNRLMKSDDRCDEAIRMKIHRIVERGRSFGFIFKGFDYGLNRTFSDYDKEMIKFTNMHPYHCFKFNFEVQYNTICYE